MLKDLSRLTDGEIEDLLHGLESLQDATGFDITEDMFDDADYVELDGSGNRTQSAYVSDKAEERKHESTELVEDAQNEL